MIIITLSKYQRDRRRMCMQKHTLCTSYNSFTACVCGREREREGACMCVRACVCARPSPYAAAQTDVAASRCRAALRHQAALQMCQISSSVLRLTHTHTYTHTPPTLLSACRRAALRFSGSVMVRKLSVKTDFLFSPHRVPSCVFFQVVIFSTSAVIFYLFF